MKNKPLLVIIACVALLFLSVGITISKYLATNMGPLGDAFNGLTAPFIALLSAGLIFYSFQEQIKANKLQVESNKILQGQWAFERNLVILNDIKTAHDKIEFITVQGIKFNGKFAIGEILAVSKAIDGVVEYDSHFCELNYILAEFNFLIRRIRESDLESKKYLWLKAQAFYENELSKNLKRFEINFEENYYEGEAVNLKGTIDKLNKNFDLLVKELLKILDK